MCKYQLKILLLFAITCISCDDFPNNPELIDKFRTIGVGLKEASYTYSTDGDPRRAELSFYFATPSTKPITSDNLEIVTGAKLLTFSDPVLEIEKSKLNIYRIDATAEIPQKDELFFNPDDENTATINYSAIFTQDIEEERVFGKIRIYESAKATDGSVTAPTVTIKNRTEGDALSGDKIELKAEVGNKISESYRTAWLVSSGEVKEYRKREVEWEKPKKGKATIILTVRGLTSYNFDFEAIDVTIK